MRKATSHGDVGEVEGLTAVLLSTEAVRLWHVHVAVQKTTRDTTFSCAWKERSRDPCGWYDFESSVAKYRFCSSRPCWSVSPCPFSNPVTY
jgi:hypothetical protein